MKMPCDPAIPMHTHRLLIRRCEVPTWIGVYEHEQTQRTTLLFDLDLDIDGRLAAAGDCIGGTVDYGQVVEDLRGCLYDKRHYLVETLADFVADRVLQRFKVVRVRVAVSKQSVLQRVASVGVEVERYQRTIVTAAPDNPEADMPSVSPQASSMAPSHEPTTLHISRKPA